MTEKRYGDNPDGTRNTIHGSGTIDIQVDDQGKILRVWFRCLSLPFRLDTVTDHEVYNPEHVRIMNIETDDTGVYYHEVYNPEHVRIMNIETDDTGVY
jgi:hypothetical protein